MSDTALTKIHFRLVQDGDGYPPVTTETVWARAVGSTNEYIVTNVPFFATDATLGDTITATLDEDGHWRFERVVRRGGHSLLRVVGFDRQALQGVAVALRELGCVVEALPSYNLLAVSVPPGRNLAAAQEYLARHFENGDLDYEEPILSDSEDFEQA